MADFTGMTLPEKLDVACSIAFLLVAGLLAYSTIQTMQTHKKINKRLHLEDTDE